MVSPQKQHHLIKCPNAGNLGIHKNTTKVIKPIRSKCKNKQQDSTKHNNLATTNFSNLDHESKERIWQQVFTSVSAAASKTASIASSITGVTGGSSATSPEKGGPKHFFFLYDAQVLNTNIHHPVLPIFIQSVMLHIQIQLSPDLNNSSCPSICCVVDTTTPCTSNYHFFAALAKRYPQCVAKIFLPADYSPIILSRITQDNVHTITTNLPVAFQFHLPYLTKDGSATSFVIATEPQVSMNTVLNLPLIKANSMMIHFIDKVVKAKHLNCPPLKIEFYSTMKTIPASTDNAPTTHYIKFEDVHNILQKNNASIAGVCECF
jgi:hypothetical protein